MISPNQQLEQSSGEQLQLSGCKALQGNPLSPHINTAVSKFKALRGNYTSSRRSYFEDKEHLVPRYTVMLKDVFQN